MAEASGGARAATTSQDDLLIVLRVVKARMLRNFETFGMGRMDPQATVEWIDGGKAVQIAKTRVDWNGHLTPKWDHTCRGRPYDCGEHSDAKVEFKVFEADLLGPSTFCGSAVCTPKALVKLPAGQADHPEALKDCVVGPMKELTLTLPKSGSKKQMETTGKITVQAILLKRSMGVDYANAVIEPTAVESDTFETPVKRVQVSGGTAPFFNLVLRNPPAGKSRSYYIGKDLSHATDEINFYETALQSGKKNGDLRKLLEYCPDYLGVFQAVEDGKDESIELLVMRNLKDGQTSARMLDIKMGQKTGQAGWQGKSRSAALRQSIVDGLTNTACEGFRLEGFDERPNALLSMDPLLDVGSTTNKKWQKKAHRVLLQRMTASEMLMHYLDLHSDLAYPDDKGLQSTLCPSELIELVLHESARSLCKLAVACRRTPVPQKWIGSSVALGFDCGKLPPRSKGEDAIRKSTMVSIFDWGRSELNTFENHLLLSEKDQTDRSQFWSYYVGGVDRLAWEAARAYTHRLSVADVWADVVFVVHDFDSMTANDFLGKVRVPLQACGSTTRELEGPNGSKRGEITYSIAWQPIPQPSRLKGCWKVTVGAAAKLPASDGIVVMSSSDPFVEVVAISQDGQLGFRQMTEVKVKSLSPEWNETFEIPIVSRADNLREALNSVGVCIGTGMLEAEMFPMEEAIPFAIGRRYDPVAAEKGLLRFVDMLDRAVMEELKKEGKDSSVVQKSHSGKGTTADLPGEEGKGLLPSMVNVDFDGQARKCCSTM